MEVSDHHCNRLDPCSKQSPFLFELPLVFGFPSSRILGCDQYYCLNWKQEMLSVDCCMAGVFTGLYQNSFTLVCQVVLYLYCCLFCIMQVGGVKPIWGITEGEEKCTAPWAKWDWNRSLCDRCPVLKISLGSTREKWVPTYYPGTAAFLFLSYFEGRVYPMQCRCLEGSQSHAWALSSSALPYPVPIQLCWSWLRVGQCRTLHHGPFRHSLRMLMSPECLFFKTSSFSVFRDQDFPILAS